MDGVAISEDLVSLCEGDLKTRSIHHEKEVPKWTPLHKAVERGKIKEVKRILKSKKQKPIHYYKDEWTPLHEACSKGRAELVQLLIESGADVNFTTELSWTALHVASECGQLDIIKLLVQNGADLNCKDVTNWTPLHLTSYYGHIESTKFLLEQSILSTDVKAEMLWTPLQIAAYRGHLEIVVILLEAGARITYDATFPALLLSCAEGHDAVVRHLLEADDFTQYKKETILGSLYRSVHAGYTSVVKQLLDCFGKVCYMNSDLQIALELAVDVGDDELVKQTLKLGADPNKVVGARSCLVVRALRKGFLNTAAILLAHGALAASSTMVEDHLNPFQSGIQCVLLHHSSSFAMLSRGLRESEAATITEAFNSVTEPLTVAVLKQKSRVLDATLNIIASDETFCLAERIFVRNSIDRLDLRKILESMKGFHQLKCLHLSGCKLDDLPQLLIETLPQLMELDVSCNKIIKLSEEISKMTNLIKLVLSFNMIQALPISIGKFRKLEVLQCNSNHLEEIPNSLSDLSESLEVLVLDSNKITLSGVPNSLVNLLKKLKRFSFSYNPLALGLSSVSTTDLIAYLEELRENPVQNNEVKLSVVGQEGVGKSCLVNALNVKNWAFQSIAPQEKTDGVEIAELHSNDINFRIFDLAGDVDFLETHMLFCAHNTLFLNVFDLTAHVVRGESPNQFGRMLIWLQSIFAVDPHSRAILVGTHGDDPRLSSEILDQIAAKLFSLLQLGHLTHRLRFKGEDRLPQCILCQSKLMVERETLNGVAGFVAVHNSDTSDCENENVKTHFEEDKDKNHLDFPHIVGYYEVSSVAKLPRKIASPRNMSIEQLKSAIAREGAELIAKNPTIPRKWLDVRRDILQRIDSNEFLKEQPVMSRHEYCNVARKHGVCKDDRLLAMLRYFHSLGCFLYFDNGPDIIVLNPQWLARQICTLLSYKQSWIESGFLDHKILSEVWSHMSSDNQCKLLELFRQLGLCIPVSGERKELFPCRLPIGHPQEDMWPRQPDVGQKQLTLTRKFSFIPINFFGKLIVEINKGKLKFAPMTKPLYLANHVVFISEENPAACGLCSGSFSDDIALRQGSRHRVHLELKPYFLSLETTVRGPRACCLMESLNTVIRGLLQAVNVSVKTSIVCPKCFTTFKDFPFLFHEENLNVLAATCGYGHDLGSWEQVLRGHSVVLDAIDYSIGKLEERLDERHCPRLFTLLPVNKECLPFKEFLVHSLLKDGFEVHLLCEFPGEWHFLQSPGFRVSKPKAFVRKYGKRVYQVLKLVSHLEKPLKVSACFTLRPELEGAAVATIAAGKLANTLKEVLQDFETLYPDLRTRGQASSCTDLEALMHSEGLNRRELARFLNVVDEEQRFGALLPTRIGNSVRWLCEQHYFEKRQVGVNL